MEIELNVVIFTSVTIIIFSTNFDSPAVVRFGLIRNIQVNTSNNVPNTFVVNSLDQGDPVTGDIHSPYKAVVGYRASLLSRSVAYGDTTAYGNGPRAQYATKFNNQRVLIGFDPNSLYGQPLQYNASVTCPPNINPASCESLAILSSSDCQWYSLESHPTLFTVDQDPSDIVLTVSDTTLDIVSVRGHFGNWPVAKLTNSQGIPADTFLFENLGGSHSCETVGGAQDLAKWAEGDKKQQWVMSKPVNKVEW